MIKEYQVAAGVMAFSTTRKGGVSQGNYGEFNINEYCGDFAEHVAENRKRLATELGIDTAHIIMPHQVHGVEVRNIAGEFLTMPESFYFEAFLFKQNGNFFHFVNICSLISVV